MCFARILHRYIRRRVIYGSTVMIAGSPIDNSIFVVDELGSLACTMLLLWIVKPTLSLQSSLLSAGAVLKEGDAEGSLGVVEQFTLSLVGAI